MPSDKFTFIACDLVTNSRRSLPEVPFTDFTWTETLDHQGTIDGTLPAFHPAATNGTLEPGATSLYIDHNGQLRYGGIIWEHDIDQDQTMDWRIMGENHFSYYLDGSQGPRRLMVDRRGMNYAVSTGAVNGQAVEITFPNAQQVAFGPVVDQFNIVADLLRHAASIGAGGNVGFDAVRFHGPGVASPEGEGGRSGVTWAKSFWSSDLKGIGQAISEIGQSYPGFDWAVNYAWDQSTSPWTPRKYFDLYYPRRGIARSGVVLEHGGNVWLVKINRSARNMANTLYGIGASQGSATLRSTQSDPSVVAPAGSYPYVSGTYSAYEEAVQANLDSRTRSRLAVTRLPVYTITVRVNSDPTGQSIRLGDVSVGDTCRFTTSVPGSGFMIDDWFRVTQQTVKVNSEGIDNWELLLSPDSVTTGIY